MSNSNNPQRDVSVLHPAIRDAVVEVEKKLNADKHPFKVFEAYRTPQRQAYLYSKGRSRPGSIVTKARPWSSFHQYGLAADFVLFRSDIKGGWSWQTSGKWGRSWEKLHEVAEEFGLRPLSWEKPHLQIKGVSIKDLRNGDYPTGGDDAWGEHLEAMIIGWGRQPPAPNTPKILPHRPAIEVINTGNGEDAMAEDADDVLRPASPGDSAAANGASHFPTVQAIVDKWEGGYVNHPQDRGGPTNMGITIATLSDWRGRKCTPSDVKNLTRREAWDIMKAGYFDKVCGDELPLPLALAAHNAAVLHGPRRSGRFLQTALVDEGFPVAIDGIVGPETLGAVAKADPLGLTDEFFDAQRDYFRKIERNRPADWRAFGRGWMRRFNDIQSNANALAQSVDAPETIDVPLPPARPSDVVDSDDDRFALDDALKGLIDRIIDREDKDMIAKDKAGGDGGLTVAQLKAIIGVADALNTSGAIESKPLTTVLRLLAGIESDDKTLTTVNGALGQTIGKMLDGRKSAIGIVGSLAVSLFEPLQGLLTGTAFGPAFGALAGSSGVLLPITLAMTAWGILGKFDKWNAKRR